ncbi:MAG: hypothetical protein SGI73_12355 [Chloroflexota bacterium]|nr:hypothetical protein [Chloroflexota bacterium]
MDTKIVELAGYISGIRYQPTLSAPLITYPLSDFDVNAAKPSGLIEFADGDTLAYSKWKTPKRTRTYPFARIYNTYHLNTKKVTIIPIIKDEGADTQNNDRINFITYSWMNLMNVYIILAWYDDATARRDDTGRITNQHLQTDFVKQALNELQYYQASALHWNKMHFERDFEFVYRQAVGAYERIAHDKQIRLHSIQQHLTILGNYLVNDHFLIEAFKVDSLPRSAQAARRELLTTHRYELLREGGKGLFTISNYLGGEYHLTADEVFLSGDKVIIQESKNGRGKLPSIDDIKDGLFKLILFANLERLELDGEAVGFSACLNLTGNLIGQIQLPATSDEIGRFCVANQFSARQLTLISVLQQEATMNLGLQIRIGGQS